MAATNRAGLITASHKVVKKHYTPAEADSRPLLEQLAFAALLENSPRAAAEQCFSVLVNNYYDWNEVRVTSLVELSEVCAKLPQPEASAAKLKSILQNVFESLYTFDLESLKKLNQGKAIKQIERFNGVSQFVVGYVTQNALGGHAVPTDDALVELMRVLGIITDAEAKKNSVPGVERAIPKTKGVEYSSLIHELAVEFMANPYSKKVRDHILEIAPDAKTRFPKRPTAKEEAAAEAAAVEKAEAKAAKIAAKKAAAEKPPKPAAAKPTKKAAKKKAAPAEKKAPEKKAAEKPAKAAEKKPAEKKAAEKKPVKKKVAKKSTGAIKRKPK
ncbi:hypothetical protein LOC68_25145 [Blastopirellula sp. JC732]|uniref:Uncharacterized protein n=1 Tax=Blastopirellula sediminis TaxID=2894196 RepID=A0A9X1MS13_9BACT|nr:hypothetical protein [Blastopirellula sediminis]MCC9605004.1 hypothetical protein [Blastopirellula sediminis]MCC9631696.1 hypothetical protein [Blastopirellula sediminis]